MNDAILNAKLTRIKNEVREMVQKEECDRLRNEIVNDKMMMALSNEIQKLKRLLRSH